MVMLTGVGGAILLPLSMGNPPIFTGDEEGEPFCDGKHVAVETAELRTGDDIVSYLRWNQRNTTQINSVI
jgi:hypothetical protein